MQTQKILDIVHQHLPKDSIYSVDIAINEHNHQIDSLKIILKPDLGTISLPMPNYFIAAGHILEDIDNYTIADEYGDITGATFEFSSMEELEDDLTVSLTMTFNIDS